MIEAWVSTYRNGIYTPVSATTGVFVTIKDPEGLVIVNEQEMDSLSPGIYFTVWQTTAVLEIGQYSCEITAQDQYTAFKKRRDVHLD